MACLARNKYGAKKIKDPASGYVFDSKAEFIRWCELRIMERAGLISDLKRQVTFELIPTQRAESTEVYKAGPQKGLPKPGAVLEKPCSYVADFTYYQNGEYIVEDVKGVRTEVFKLKKKLMLYVHGIQVKET